MAKTQGQGTFQAYGEPAGYYQITNLAAATLLNANGGPAAFPTDCKYVMIQPEGQNVRYRDDGTDPTASVGMLLVANDVLVYSGDLSKLKFIQATASAKLNFTFYK